MRKLLEWVLVATLLASCGGGRESDGGWDARVVFTAPDKIGGLDIGDLDPDRPGLEIACVLRTGAAYLVGRRTDGKWSGEEIAVVGGEMLQCAIGDVDERTPGNELVIAGMLAGTEEDGGPGAVYVVSRADGKWHCELAWQAPALVHGVTVMDIDPRRPGNEIVAVGFDRAATLVFRDGDGWAHEKAVDLTGRGKSVVPRGGEAVIATDDGTVTALVRVGDAWGLKALSLSVAGQSRLGVAPDGRIVSAGDDGVLRLIDGKALFDIHREGRKLRGAVLADLDPASPGLEAATASYLMKITVLYPPKAASGNDWRPEVVFTDTGKFHHLDAGDLIPESPGDELAGCGYSKNLVIVSRK